MKKTIVSGAQATGNLHLGNYLGAITQWVKLQDEYNSFFFLADLHAITVPQEPSELKTSTLSVTATYLACGLDPAKVTIFAQSHVKEHAELAWILNCVTPLGWLKRMTQFKDKAGKNQEDACLGLFSYPVLMAADILLYNADIVPVGEDQKQHLELTRDIAGLINRRFDKQVFKTPAPLIESNVKRIMSLTDGRKKMSKSEVSDLSRINLNDSPEIIQNKMKKAKTDSMAGFSYDPLARPELSNLINIFSYLSSTTIENIISNYDNVGFAKFKNDLSELIISHLDPIRDNYNHYLNNQDHLLTVLRSGADKAREKASNTLSEVKELFGFI
jgi:tryptophanyl-tRNA synthetase